MVRGLVSVIIPCYNRADYIGETITSVLHQSYRPVETIVVDDGSTDESASVAGRFPVRFIRQANQGVAVAMNTGIAAARGEFVSTLGSDDLMHEDYLEACMRALTDDPGASFAYTQMVLFGAVNRLYQVHPFDPETLAENDYAPAVFLMRRSAFQECGPFDTQIPRCEDWDLLLTMAERGRYGVYIPRPLFYYRQHNRSYNSHDFLSPTGLRRELAMAIRLKARHLPSPSPYAIASLALLGLLLHAWHRAPSAIRPLWPLTSLMAVLIDPHLVDYDLTVLVAAGIFACTQLPRLRWWLALLFVLLTARAQVSLGPTTLQLVVPALCLPAPPVAHDTDTQPLPRLAARTEQLTRGQIGRASCRERV